LAKTIDDLIAKASQDVEVITVLEGYWPDPPLKERDNLVIIHRGEAHGMRAAINSAVGIARGEYLMKVDAHCMFAEGYDEILKSNCDDNWVVIPRRFTLDTEKWAKRQATPDKPHVDYEYFIYPRKYNPVSLHGFRWIERTMERSEILLDDTLTFQGSCWFMSKSHFDRYSFMNDPGYMGVPKQEAEEIGLTTWLNGGRLVVNKEVWYAHQHKKYAGYPTNREITNLCYEYSYNKWVVENKDKFIDLIDKFMPLPGWPTNYVEELWK
jgi:hypothetical protein